MWPLFSITPESRRALLDEKNGGPLSVLHVSKRGIFRLGFQNLGETLLGVLSVLVVSPPTAVGLGRISRHAASPDCKCSLTWSTQNFRV